MFIFNQSDYNLFQKMMETSSFIDDSQQALSFVATAEELIPAVINSVNAAPATKP